MKDTAILVLALTIGVCIIAYNCSPKDPNESPSQQEQEKTSEQGNHVIGGEISEVLDTSSFPPVFPVSTSVQSNKTLGNVFEQNDLINTSDKPIEQLESYTKSLGESFLSKNNLWTGTAKIDSLVM